MTISTITRRDFIKKTGKASVVGATSLYFGSLASCATVQMETRDNVDNLTWDCNPALPIPKNGGIYIGTNKLNCAGQDGNQYLKKGDYITGFKKKYGKMPTIIAIGFGRIGAIDGIFPHDSVKIAHTMGTIPMIRYIVTPGGNWGEFSRPSKGYKIINSGIMDDDIRVFGAEAAKLKKPIIVCPFQQPNDVNSKLYKWSGPGISKHFKEAYVRIHKIWKQEGALENIVMGVKLKVGRWQRWSFPDPLAYIPPKDTVDIIGWCALNFCQLHRYTPSISFNRLLKADYNRVVRKYRDIPQFIWELACHEPCNQAAWLDDALTQIEEKYHWIKAVNLDECADGIDDFQVDPRPNKESRKVIQKHFADHRYIGSILPS